MIKLIKKGGYIAGLVLAGVAGWYLAGMQVKTDTVDPEKEYLVTVNGQGLEKEWFIEQMKLRGGLKPGQFQTVEQKKALLDVLVNEEVIYQQAMDQGISEDPAVSRLYKKAVIDKFISETLNRKIEQVKVGDSEVESHYNQNKSVYNKPARRRAAIIVAELTGADDDAAKAKKYKRLETALEAINELDENTHHFGELAKVYSDDRASMYQGGVIGWLINSPSRKYKWDHSLVEALFALQNPGDVSSILTTENGYYIVRLVAAENVKEKSFNQLQKGIKNQLVQNKRREVKAAFMNGLIGEANIDVNTNMLATIPTLSPKASKNENTPPALPSVGGAQ